MDKKLLGKRINTARKDRGWTSERLSEACNINATYLRKIESGAKTPSLQVFVTLCSTRSRIRVAGNDYPAEVVRSKLLKLNSEHIRFVMDCLKQNTTRIRNIRQYLLTALFNAPSTMNSYYTALVAHDMAA